MSKITNTNLASLQVAVLGSVIDFDEQGIAEIESEEVYNLLTTMPGYSPVEDTAPVNENTTAEAPTEEAPAEEAPAWVPEEAPAEEAPVVPAPKAASKKK